VRKADLLKNHSGLDEAIARYRTFMDKIIDAQRVISSAQEKRDLAESVLLRLCANWESFVDEHLVDCVNCDHSQLSTFFGVTIPANPSKDLCQALIFGDGFRDFKSFGDLKGYTKRILPTASNPFLAISDAHHKRIDEVYRIRNYLSHYSTKGRRSLMALYRDEYRMERFLEPGQFLLAYNARRLWTYCDAFAGASADMKATY
jgi:hypothetical protein